MVVFARKYCAFILLLFVFARVTSLYFKRQFGMAHESRISILLNGWVIVFFLQNYISENEPT